MKPATIPETFAPRRILAAAGKNANSDNALRAAARLAERFGAEIDVVHALEEPRLSWTRFQPEQIAEMTAVHREQQRRVLGERLQRDLPDVQPAGAPWPERLRVVDGHPARVLVEEARRTGADVIVIGSSGKHKQLDFGGAARALLADAPCPIWFQTESPRELRSILVPVDLSAHSLRVLRLAVDLASRLGAGVVAMHCFDASEYTLFGVPDLATATPVYHLAQTREDARGHFHGTLEGFDWRGVQHEERFVEDLPFAAIQNAQAEFDLIALGTHGRTGIAATLLGSTAYAVLRQAHTPVLAVRIGSDAG